MRVLLRLQQNPSLTLVAGLVLTVLGGLVLTNRPGLRVEYFAGPADFQPHPVFTDVGWPQLGSRTEVSDVLVSQEVFELRWRGWLHVQRPGDYRFLLEADENASLTVEGTELAVTSRSSRSVESGEVTLSRGLHPIEVGFTQTGGRAHLALSWGPVGEPFALLVGPELISGRPTWIRTVLPFRAMHGLPSVVTRFVGLGLLILGFGVCALVLRSVVARRLESVRRWGRTPERQRALQAAFLLALFLGSCALIFPFTADTADGDDVRYMDAASFGKKMGWIMNRYVHIYLLRAFIWLEDGDAFLGSRAYWAFLFGVVILSLAMSTRSLGTGLQIPTLGVAIFLLLAQSYLFLGVGAAYADYSAMMFVAAGVAVYLDGTRGSRISLPRSHLVALGALSVAAAKSKEPGLILLWLLLALLWHEGRIDLRRFGRQLVWWGCGAGTAYAGLMILDWIVLGDLWFSLRLESLAGAQRLKQAAEGIWQLPQFAWLEVAWTRGSMRILSVAALLAAGTALLRRWSMPQRIVALMPVAFMVMMIAIHPAITSTRYLLPIVPVACLSVAMMMRDLSGSSVSKGRVRQVSLGLGLILVFGTGFTNTWMSLSRHRAVQTGDWTLYPWEVFREPIEEGRPKQIHVSPRLFRTYQMVGKSKTRDRIARLFFRRQHLRLRTAQGPDSEAEMAVLTRGEYQRWLAIRPELQDRATFDPSGQIVLLRLDSGARDSTR